MKFSHVAAATMLLGSFGLQAEVPELLELVPEAKGYELIAKFNPLRWRADGYQTDRSEQLSGDLKRIGYLVKLTAKNGETSWVFASMDAFTQVPALAGVPSPDSQSFQQYVTNLEVAGNVAGVKTGKFEKGNIEIWGLNYGEQCQKHSRRHREVRLRRFDRHQRCLRLVPGSQLSGEADRFRLQQFQRRSQLRPRHRQQSQ